MIELTFDAADFKKSVLETIQPETQALQDLIKTKADIEAKKAEFSKKLKELNSESSQLFYAGFGSTKKLVDLDYETYKSKQEKMTAINNEINTIKQYIITLGDEAKKCKDKIDPAKAALIRAFSEAVQAYLDKARIPILEFIEEILNNNNAFSKAAVALAVEFGNENELTALGFGPNYIPLNLYPLQRHIPRMESFLAEKKADAGQL